MEIERLRNLIVLAEERHFGRAAQRLHITQPALSRQVKAVERELRVPLFDRDAHRVEVTRAGAVLFTDAAELIQRYDELLARTSRADNGVTGHLRIAYSMTAARTASDTLVQTFRDRFPNVEVTATDGWSELNVELLASGRLDIGFVRPPVKNGVALHPLGNTELAVAIHPEHPLAASTRIAPEQLREVPVILWSRNLGFGYFRRTVEQIWGDTDSTLIREEPALEPIVATVAAGEGAAVVDLHRLEQLHPTGITLRRFTPPAPTAELAVAWNPDNHSPLIGRFLECCT